MVEAKAAYFRPTSPVFRDIYSDGGIYGAEVSCQAWKELYGWVSGSVFHKTGSSLGSHDSTKVTFVPIGLGLKYLFPIDPVDLYLGGGILATYLHLTDDSPYVIHERSKWGVGGIIKGGLLFNITHHVFIDVCSDYSWTQVGFHDTHHHHIVSHDANLSGWSIGAGVGYRLGPTRNNKKTSHEASY
jgi:opacity protein-like surface antigen